MSIRIDRAKLRDVERREPLLRILEASLAAVDPHLLVRSALTLKDGTLRLRERRLDVRGKKLWVLSIGKAACAMAQGVADVLGPRPVSYTHLRAHET